MVAGLRSHDLMILGGRLPIISVLVGDEEQTFLAGKFLFDRGFYVQSVTFPAVRYHAGVLRIQVNANHLAEEIDGLVSIWRIEGSHRLADQGTCFRLPPKTLSPARWLA